MNEPNSFTYDDFADGTAPYEYVYQFEEDRFRRGREMDKMSKIAMKVRFTRFQSSYKDYVKKIKESAGIFYADSCTQFEDQPLELDCGQWRADDMGISIDGKYGEVFACNHPILPVERLVNIDTGIEKLRLAYRKGKRWRYIIADKKTLANSRSIIDLADMGVAVNSENSKYLVQYLYDLEHLNYDKIPELSSVARLGWIDGQGFSPYVGNLIFDGDESFRSFFRSVREGGSYDGWLSLAREIRVEGSVPARMVLAASFASALVSRVDALSFFVHLWGSESGTGKTVALMLAASVWANPEKGQFWRTFNGTAVGQELSAGFVNSMPLILDEFQMFKNKKDFEQIVYMLAEGVGKTRATKVGGLQRVPTWCNCILTSGEMPITNFMTGAGAFNRIVEIECTEKIFPDPVGRVLPAIRTNYGFAGKRFVERLQDPENIKMAKAYFESFCKEINGTFATEKQAMAGSIILAADALATEWIFQDGNALKTTDISQHLQTKSDVDINGRAYDYICECIASNSNRFGATDNNGEIWGKLTTGEATIIRKIFDRICEEGGYSSRAVLSWLARKGMIETTFESKKGKSLPTKVVKINGTCVRCVVLRMPLSDVFEGMEGADLPF